MASRGWGREERERETEREERRERETDMRSEKRCGGGDIACTWRDVSGVFFFDGGMLLCFSSLLACSSWRR